MEDADYRLHRSDAYRLLYGRTRDHALSEDLTQDVFVRLTRYRSGSVSNLGALVRAIAANLLRDHMRGARRRAEEALPEQLEIASDAPSQHEILVQRQRVEHVSGVLAEMPPLRRDVFLRRRLHGQSAREVANDLGLTVAAVDQHVARAVLMLHNRMRQIDRTEDAA